MRHLWEHPSSFANMNQQRHYTHRLLVARLPVALPLHLRHLIVYLARLVLAAVETQVNRPEHMLESSSSRLPRMNKQSSKSP